MSVPYGSKMHLPPTNKMHLPPTNYHLLATQQRPSLNEKCWEKFLENKAHLLTKSVGRIFWKKSGKWTASREWQDGKSKRTTQKNERGDRKEESNDSPEIPVRRKTPDLPSLPSGVYSRSHWSCRQSARFAQASVVLWRVTLCLNT